jgi:hypothetical protein
VSGLTDLKSTLSVGGNTFLSGTLSVLQDTNLGSKLSVNGQTFLSNTLSVLGGVQLGNKLSVQDASYFSSSISVAGTADVVSATKLGNILSVSGATTIANSLSVSGTTDILSATKLGDILSVSGATTINNTLSVNSTLDVSGLTRINGTLSVLSSIKTDADSFVNGILSVNGATYINSQLSVNGDVIIDGTANRELFVNTINKHNGETLTINAPTLVVNGNLDVVGTYNTIDVTTSQLFSEDKTIVLGTSDTYILGTEGSPTDPSDGVDETTNNEGGILIAGKPLESQITLFNDTYATNYSITNNGVWEKSFKWNVNQGATNYGHIATDVSTDSSCREDEPFWELKGGAFHLSSTKLNDLGNEVIVKYGLRINANEELEIIKKVGDDATKRVAKFGITSAL